MDLTRVTARVTVDNSGLRRGLDDAVDDAKRAGDKIEKNTQTRMGKLKGMAASGVKAATPYAAAGLAAIGTMAFTASQKAADLAETQSKVGVIFGESAKAIEEYAKAAPEALGQTSQQAMDAASTFATFGKSAKLTGDDLTGFSTEMVGLSSDLASFHNVEPQEAIEALGSALRGEAEPMRRFGVLLDDASMRQQALKMGLVKTTKEALTPQQKVLAAQALIMKQTTDAQGDFARTSSGAANQQRILTAQLEQAHTELGAALLPVLKQAVTALAGFAKWARENESLVKILIVGVAGFSAAILVVRGAMIAWTAIQGVATAAQWAFNAALSANPIGLIVIAIAALVAGIIWAWNNVDWFREGVLKLWEGFKVAFSKIWDIVKAVFGWLRDNWKTVLAILAGPIGLAVKSIIDHWDTIKDTAGRLLGWVRDGFRKVADWLTLPFRVGIRGALITFNWLRDKINTVWEWLKGIGTKFVSPLIAAFNTLKEAFRTIINFIIGAWNAIDLSISVPDWVPGIGGKGVDDLFPDIPMLAAGGIATGPTLAMIGEAGPEAVVPLNKASQYGFGNSTPNVGSVTIHIGDGVRDPQQVKRAARDGLIDALSQVADGVRYGGAY